MPSSLAHLRNNSISLSRLYYVICNYSEITVYLQFAVTVCGLQPIIGTRYSRAEGVDTYDLCQVCRDQLQQTEQESLSKVDPVRLRVIAIVMQRQW